jgi:hypothetical protein
VSGHALDFANGPYSAKAIALRSTMRGAPPYPGQDHLFTAALYFLKAAQLNMGPAFWGQLLWALALLGSALALWRVRRYGVFLLLWLPLAFYALSVAYGSVPIYIPAWYPFSYYNARYGLELLPAFAVFIAAIAAFLSSGMKKAFAQIAIWGAILVVIASSYIAVYAESPITLREARVNSRGRLALEQGLARILADTPPSATLLMYEAEHAGALRMARIPLRHVISEAEHPDWELALLDPAHHADYIVACEGDPVWTAVRQQKPELTQLVQISAPGQSSCAVYKPK